MKNKTDIFWKIFMPMPHRGYPHLRPTPTPDVENDVTHSARPPLRENPSTPYEDIRPRRNQEIRLKRVLSSIWTSRCILQVFPTRKIASSWSDHSALLSATGASRVAISELVGDLASSNTILGGFKEPPAGFAAAALFILLFV